MVSSEEVAAAVQVLREGGLVALPTETVYGLAADASNELAVRRIFAAKGRPQSHPLIVHLPDARSLDAWAVEIPERARRLADAFWPGPLTLVLKKREGVSHAVTGGQDTVALRVPAHPLAQAVLREFGGGVAAPSANRFGHVSPTTAAHVRADLGDEVDLVLDGGACAVGLESTIVDLSGARPALLRPGGLPAEEVERVLGEPLAAPSSQVRAPGLLPSHYAPRAGLLLVEPDAVAQKVAALVATGRKVAVLAPEGTALPQAARAFVLPADPAGFARGLYATLREIDEAGLEVIVAAPPPDGGLGTAVRDRLRRASAPR
jgi:L-threonylcarbamoyladenylate synthase